MDVETEAEVVVGMVVVVGSVGSGVVDVEAVSKTIGVVVVVVVVETILL